MAAVGQAISSPANTLIKDVRRALAKGEATSAGFLVSESFHLLDEALRSTVEWLAVLTTESAFAKVEERLRGRPDIVVRLVEDSLFRSIVATETSQGVISLVRPRLWRVADLFADCPLVVALDGLQDPGNAGAIFRSAEAFGATGVAFLHGTVDPANPKAVRASAGSLFRVPFLRGLQADKLTAELSEHGVQALVASPRAERPLEDFDLTRPTALVIGSESRGVSPVLQHGAQLVRIPTAHVESLNASIAAAVLLYEAARQRTRAAASGTTEAVS